MDVRLFFACTASTISECGLWKTPLLGILSEADGERALGQQLRKQENGSQPRRQHSGGACVSAPRKDLQVPVSATVAWAEQSLPD